MFVAEAVDESGEEPFMLYLRRETFVCNYALPLNCDVLFAQ